MKVLVVDDSELNRKLLISTLQKAGVQNEIIEVGDGKEALNVLNGEFQNICLVFLDWQLPKVDGLEVLKQMARNPDTQSLPVIMLTSAVSPESREIAELLNSNLKAFVMKPLNPAEILEIAKLYLS